MMKRFLLALVLCFSAFSIWASNPTPLPFDEAFALTVKGVDHHDVLLHWDIAQGYHLYRNQFHFALENPSDATIGQVVLPPGIAKQDDILGKYHVYENSLDLTVPFSSVKNTKTVLLVSYQGCSDANFCYPPATKKLTINFSGVSSDNNESIQEKITHLLKQGNYFWICLAFMGFGILLAFTPCVLPMIPILSGIIVGQSKKNLNTRQAFFLSLSYVLGMSIAYALAGVLVALAGSHLSEALQAPWVIVLFSLLFVALALSLFGLYEIRLPHFLQHPIVLLSNRQKSGSYIGVVIMGALSVLIVSPCVTAPLVGVLTFIAQSGNVILGSTALFCLGLGMGIPLLIIGTTEGRFLPKTGKWMHAIKIGFGILLLGVAVMLLERVIPASMLPQQTQFTQVKTMMNVQQVIATAHKPVMLDFSAQWCVACQEMEKDTFSNPDVKKALGHFLVLQADVTKNDADDKALEAYYNVIAPPTILFFNAKGQELPQARIVGGMGPKPFLEHLKSMDSQL